MRIGTLLLISILFVMALVSAVLWRWPAYQRNQQQKSGFQAAELGAHLSYLENRYRHFHGTFTEDFSQLQPYADEKMPCALTSSPYLCGGYAYTLEGHWLVMTSQLNPEDYLAFELLQGGVDCSHAPEGLEKTPICSSLQ